MEKSRKYGLIGYPVRHSYSPSMHNAAFKYLKIDAKYELFEVPPEELTKFLRELPSKICGCNVTIPHKMSVRDFIEKEGKLTEYAEKIGAVNTILVKENRLIGDNTDGRGFMGSLDKDLSFNPKDKTICMVGAGGAARSIVMQMGDFPKKIYVIDVVKEQLNSLIKNYEKYYDSKIIEGNIIEDRKARTYFVKKSDLLVNATPVGMKHMQGCVVEEDALHKDLAVFDIIYNPRETELIKLARRQGIEKVVNGEGMLLYQGALSFSLWTGQAPPVEVMRKALQEKINSSNN